MRATGEDTNLESRRARSALAPRHKPYRHALDEGGQLGYYKGTESRLWIARFCRAKGRYAEQRVGLADDLDDADGAAVLDFEQAQAAARNWCAARAVEQATPPIDDAPFNSVGAPCNRD